MDTSRNFTNNILNNSLLKSGARLLKHFLKKYLDVFSTVFLDQGFPIGGPWTPEGPWKFSRGSAKDIFLDFWIMWGIFYVGNSSLFPLKSSVHRIPVFQKADKTQFFNLVLSWKTKPNIHLHYQIIKNTYKNSKRKQIFGMFGRHITARVQKP